MMDVYNAGTGIMDDFERVVMDLFQEFISLQSRPAQIESYDIWRRAIKERYPRDYHRILQAVSERAKPKKEAG